MMRRRSILVLAVVLLCWSTCFADLHDRGSGLIFDDVLDITWLQNANYAQTSGYDSDGKMLQADAVAWADQLIYGGYSDWRLPHTLPVNPPNYNLTWSADGSTDSAANIQSPNSEMAYMFYKNLGNLSYYEPGGSSPQTGWGLSNAGPFINLQEYLYWSGSMAPGGSPTDAFYFSFEQGTQHYNSYNWFYAWAVRDGDVAVTPIPVPGAALLGFIGLATSAHVLRRRRKKAVA